MYKLVRNEDVVDEVEHGDWRTVMYVGAQITEQITEQIEGLDDPAEYTVMTITGRTYGLCPVMTADRWGHAELEEYLGLPPRSQ